MPSNLDVSMNRAEIIITYASFLYAKNVTHLYKWWTKIAEYTDFLAALERKGSMNEWIAHIRMYARVCIQYDPIWCYI